MSWLTKELKEEIRRVFESRYKTKLTEDDIWEIAENLTTGIEVILKSKCRKIDGEHIQN